MTDLRTRLPSPFRRSAKIVYCMILGSAFHVVTFSLVQILIHIQDALQIPSVTVTATGQLQVQREDVPPTVNSGAAQGTLWNPHHTNMVNYGHPELVSVSNDVHIRTINLPMYLLVMHQDLASPYIHPNVGPAHQQGIPEHMQITFHVSANLSSLHMLLNRVQRRRRIQEMITLAVPPGMLYQAPPKRPFLIRLLTSPPMLASQQQRISAESRAVTFTIWAHRLIWFAWNQARLVDTRW